VPFKKLNRLPNDVTLTGFAVEKELVLRFPHDPDDIDLCIVQAVGTLDGEYLCGCITVSLLLFVSRFLNNFIPEIGSL